jgi:hypothetical protein
LAKVQESDQSKRNAGTAFFFLFLFTLTLLSACSVRDADDLAVARLPISQMQATNFLPLNADKPGTSVDVQRYLVPGKYTIVGYFSPYDGPSMSLAPRLVQVSQVRSDIAVRTVNINRPGVQGIDWQSPIVQNAQIQTLPYFEIYDPARRLRAHGRPAYGQVIQWVRELRN